MIMRRNPCARDVRSPSRPEAGSGHRKVPAGCIRASHFAVWGSLEERLQVPVGAFEATVIVTTTHSEGGQVALG